MNKRAIENQEIADEIKEITKGLVYRERLQVARLVQRLIKINLER